MRLNISVEYALRAMLYVAKERERKVQAQEIAQACQIPVNSLRNVLVTLAAKHVIQSTAGPKGGYSFRRDPNTVTLIHVVEAVGGPIFENDCLLHGTPCPPDHWCPIHEVWEKAQMVFVKVLSQYSVGYLLERVTNWESIEQLLENLGKESARSKETRHE